MYTCKIIAVQVPILNNCWYTIYSIKNSLKMVSLLLFEQLYKKFLGSSPYKKIPVALVKIIFILVVHVLSGKFFHKAIRFYYEKNDLVVAIWRTEWTSNANDHTVFIIYAHLHSHSVIRTCINNDRWRSDLCYPRICFRIPNKAYYLHACFFLRLFVYERCTHTA